MEWVPLADYENGVNLNDRPRRLTPEEIVYITAHMPLAPSADQYSAEVARQGIIEWMTETLKETYIAPSAIPGLIQKIVEQHYKSLAVPGTPVGITAAEAVGATTTQMTLNTFHTSGSAKSASFGIDAMRDLIFARKTPKNESSTIYYTNKSITYEEVLDSRRYIVGSVVSDFILRKDNVLQFDIDSPENLERYWWHDTAEFLLKKQIPDSTKVLRLFLNVPEMFKHKVTISDLAMVLEREIPPSVVAIYGPIADGIIDIYPNPAIIVETMRERERKVVCNVPVTAPAATDANAQRKTRRAGIGIVPPELAEITFLESIVLPEFPCIRVKGISGIKQLYPLVSPVWRIVILERKLSVRDLTTPELREALGPYVGRAWLLFYNPDIMRTTGLTRENLAALCQLAGLTIVAGTPDRLIVTMPNDRFRTKRGETIYNLGDRMYREVKEGTAITLEGITYQEIDETYIKEEGENVLEEIDEKVFIPIPRGDIRKIDKKTYKRIDDTLLQTVDNKVYEMLNTNLISVSESKPGDYIAEKVARDKRLINDEIKRLTAINIAEAQNLPEPQRKALIRKPVNVPRTPLMKAAEFVIAETDGSNLKELLALPGIDKTRTTCNNMYTITAALGIEAARTFLSRAITNTISNTGSYVHPANIMFIAEFITSRGEPYGATYSGISRQPGGHLSLATVERAGKVFVQNALNGRKEDIRNVSASVAVGARMAIGNGTFDIAQDITENGTPRIAINDDLFDVLEKDDASNQLLTQRLATQPAKTITTEDVTAGIEALKSLTVGGATFDYTGAEDEANLITLFGPGEIIPDAGAHVPTEGAAAPTRKVVRRVPAQPKSPDPVVPRELVDFLVHTKIGVPLPEKITITPLTTGADRQEPVPQPIISTGLIPLTELMPQVTGTGIPVDLDDLLNRYNQILGGPDAEPVTPPELVTVVEELPTVNIPELPDLTDINFAATQIELRREQVRDLQPINVDALVGALGK